MYELFAKIKESYNASTLNNNKFSKLLKRIKWDYEFYADGEFYFVKGDFTFTTPSLNPFQMDWKPSAMFGGCSFSF